MLLKGTYGLAVDNGVCVMLSEGIHVRNSRFFEHKEFADVNQKCIFIYAYFLVLFISSPSVL